MDEQHNLEGGTCDICNKGFPTKTRLKTHVQHGCVANQPLICDICNKSFNFRRSYTAHVNKCFQCQDCKQIFKTSSDLTHHSKLGCLRRTCKECGFIFASRYGLQKHTNTGCNKKIQHFCKKCNKSYTGSLKNHRKRGCKRIPCKTCNKTFASNLTLERHVKRGCTGDQSWICKDCGRDFKEKFILLGHVKNGCGARSQSLKCDKCNHICKSQKGFRQHVTRGCPKIQSWTCKDCGNVFTLKCNLKRHNKQPCGDGMKSWECRKCNKSFTSYRGYRIHVGVGCGEIYCCKNCTQSFSLKRQLTFHNRYSCLAIHNTKKKAIDKARPHKCTECKQGFVRKYDLNRHITYTCPVLQEKKKKMSILKKYLCKDCKKNFSAPDTLLGHAKSCRVAREKKLELGEAIEYACLYCKSLFVSTRSIRRHVLRDCKFTPEKQKKIRTADGLICPECHCLFPLESNFLVHLKLCNVQEVKERKLPSCCNVCGKKCRGKRLLRLHKETCEGGELKKTGIEKISPNFPCGLCATIKASAAEMRIHLDQEHDINTSELENLSLEFPTDGEPVSIGSGIFNCSVCGQLFLDDIEMCRWHMAKCAKKNTAVD